MKNKPTLSEIEDAHLFVNMGSYGDHHAYISQETGQIYYCSESGDLNELPDDVHDSDNYIEIPHKDELDLGNNLVLRFVSEHLPEQIASVENIFSKKGAYSRFKALLTQKRLLDQWYDYENKKRSEALREWCKDNKIDIID